MKKTILFAATLSAVTIISNTGCKSNTGPAIPQQEVIKDSTKASTYENLNLLMTNIPAPSTISKELSKEGVSLNASMLNSPDKASGYTSTSQQAVNMGIYGADLGYLSSYNQMQQATTYIVQVAKLAGNLGITSAYDKTMMDQFHSAINNKDSIDIVIKTAFDQAQKELYSSKRAATSALVFAGGWVEGLYIATNCVKDEKNDKNAALYSIIWQHVYAFSYLQKALADFQSNPDCVTMSKTLQPLFDVASKLNDAGFSLNDINNIKAAVTTIRSSLI